MADYESLENAQRHFENWPKIDIAAVEEAANKHFEPYIFYRDTKEGRRLFTSCCGHEFLLPDNMRLENTAQQSVSWGGHNHEAVCPCCGRAVKLKQISKCGQAKNLAEWHPFYVFAEREGKLYAQGFWARKLYWPRDDYSLVRRPEFRAVYSYCYEPGKAVCGELWDKKWVEHVFVPGREARGTATLGKFYECGKRIPFRCIGADAIERSFLKYCQYERWSHCSLERGTHIGLPQYLLWAALYTRQVEMLVKAGINCLVTDLICGYERKRILNWQEPDLLKAFDLDHGEMKFLLERKEPYFLEHYKRLRKSGDKTSIEEVAAVYNMLYNDMRQFVSMAKRFKVPAKKLAAYLDRFTGPRCHGGYFGFASAFKLWVDYIHMMEYLERDLTAHNVIFPRELELAHNEAAAEQTIKLELENAEKERLELAKYAEGLDKRRKKYNFEFGEHFIRIAETQAEITQEGKTLQHCVGGYAQRHVQGSTTILFLRRKATPEAALYTIEMRGDELVQIHGFRNDREGPDPRKVMSEMLDVWLDWIKRGSPRDKAGVPKLRKKKEANAA